MKYELDIYPAWGLKNAGYHWAANFKDGRYLSSGVYASKTKKAAKEHAKAEIAAFLAA